MRKFFAMTFSAATLLTACGPAADAPQPEITKSETPAQTESKYDAAAQYAKFAEVPMDVDTSFLSPSEKAVVNKLIEASGYLSEIYLRQRGANYPELRNEIKAKGTPDQLKMFDLHFGPCDGLEDNALFYGTIPCPKGAGFYQRI